MCLCSDTNIDGGSSDVVTPAFALKRTRAMPRVFWTLVPKVRGMVHPVLKRRTFSALYEAEVVFFFVS